MEQALLVKFNKEVKLYNDFIIGINPYLIFDSTNNIKSIIDEYFLDIVKYEIINISKNKLMNLYNYQDTNARIEPSAFIREEVYIDDTAIILMGAVVNTKASIGKNTMIDMNAVIGSGAVIRDNCHIGAGSVIAGILEPISKVPVVIEDNCFIGANSVILEGVHIGKNSVVGAGSIVLQDVEEDSVVVGNPARYIKKVDMLNNDKIKLNKDLRK